MNHTAVVEKSDVRVGFEMRMARNWEGDLDGLVRGLHGGQESVLVADTLMNSGKSRGTGYIKQDSVNFVRRGRFKNDGTLVF